MRIGFWKLRMNNRKKRVNIFVRDGYDLEPLGSVDCFIFDKTGTLTENSIHGQAI